MNEKIEDLINFYKTFSKARNRIFPKLTRKEIQSDGTILLQKHDLPIGSSSSGGKLTSTILNNHNKFTFQQIESTEENHTYTAEFVGDTITITKSRAFYYRSRVTEDKIVIVNGEIKSAVRESIIGDPYSRKTTDIMKESNIIEVVLAKVSEVIQASSSKVSDAMREQVTYENSLKPAVVHGFFQNIRTNLPSGNRLSAEKHIVDLILDYC